MESEEKKIIDKFKRIKINSVLMILHYLDFFTLAYVYFSGKKLRKIISQKYKKKITMILISIIVYKSSIKIESTNDLKFILHDNSIVIRKLIKPKIISSLSDYYYKLPVLKYYFNHLKNKNLKSVNLSLAKIGKKSIKYLSYYLENNKTVEKLNLSDNNLTGEAILPLIKIVNTVENLVILKMNNCLLDSVTINHLNVFIKNSQSLKKLFLRNCNLDDRMICLFTKCLNLSELDLYDNDISSSGVLHICKNFPNLQKLNLVKNNLDNKSCIYLAFFLRTKNNNLLKLNIEDNLISHSGINLIFQSASLQGKLKSINISYNFRQELNLSLIHTLNLQNMKFKGYKISYDNNLSDNIKFNDNLVKIDLSNTMIDIKSLEQILKYLFFNTSIKSLNMENTFLNQTNYLNMFSNYFTYSNNIRTLNLSNNYLFKTNAKVLSEIINSKTLQHLDISYNSLNLWSQEDWNTFVESFKCTNHLESLNLSGNILDRKLTYLIKEIANINKIQILKINRNYPSTFDEDVLSCLQSWECLKELHIEWNSIEDNSTNSIINFIDCSRNKNSPIELINLKHNLFSHEGIKQYIEYFNNNLEKTEIIIKLNSYNFNQQYIKKILTDNSDEYNKLFSCIGKNIKL